MSDTIFDTLRTSIETEAPAALATIVDCPDPLAVGAKILVRPDMEPMGGLGNEDLDRVVIRDALGELSAGTTGIRHYGPNGEARQEQVAVFVESFAPPPQMLIFGAVDFTAALSRVAKILGYRVTVCDARPVFATTQRFPQADEVVVDWPHRLLEKVGPELGQRDAICVLTHDPKFDVPAVTSALKTDVGYLGAMGSRRTTEDRNRRLLEEGVTQDQLDTVFAPIGLDLGARTPEETAISICAEIISLRSGRLAAVGDPADGAVGSSATGSLRNTTGDIHS
jgi:xanthine dehydrogenase accessory factor